MDNVYELFAKISLDSSDFEKGLKNAGEQLKKIPDTISKAGATISNFGKGISSVGSKLTNSITKPALAAGTAVAGIFVAKGWSRLTQIDNAKAKLRGLGHDAESVKNIMDSALASVKGTAFGMDEAATTAASAVAAGIKQGEDLTRYLKSVGDAAAIANVPMADMGAIFNKVATSGKAQGEVLRQLADRGIPIYQWLAEEAGVAGDQVAEMAKDGAINLEMFRKAVEKHVGGAALQLGNATLTGALANVGAAISRVGANFLGAADDADSFAGKLLPVIITAQDKLGILEAKAKEWGAVVGEVFGAVITYFTKGKEAVDGLAMSAGAETAIGGFTKMGETAQKVWGVIEPILDKFTAAIEFIQSLSPELVASIAGIAVAAGPVIETGGKLVSIIGLLTQNSGLLIAAISVVIALWDQFGLSNAMVDASLSPIIEKIKSLGDIAPGITKNLTNGLKSIMDSFVNILPDALSAGTEILENVIEGITQALPELATSSAEIISVLAEGISSALPILLPKAAEAVITLADSIVNNADSLIDSALKLILSLAEGLISALPKIQEKGPVIVYKLVQAILFNLPKILAVGVELILTLVKGIVQSIGSVFIAGKSIIEEVKKGIESIDASSWGSDMMQSFINGIKSKWGDLKNACSDVAQAVKDFLGFSEPKEGPLSNFHTYAPDMMKLFAKGIADNEDLVKNQINKSFDFGNMMIDAKAATPSAGNIYITVNGAEGQSEEKLAEIVSNRLLHELNMKKAVVPTYA